MVFHNWPIHANPEKRGGYFLHCAFCKFLIYFYNSPFLHLGIFWGNNLDLDFCHSVGNMVIPSILDPPLPRRQNYRNFTWAWENIWYPGTKVFPQVRVARVLPGFLRPCLFVPKFYLWLYPEKSWICIFTHFGCLSCCLFEATIAIFKAWSYFGRNFFGISCRKAGGSQGEYSSTTMDHVCGACSTLVKSWDRECCLQLLRWMHFFMVHTLYWYDPIHTCLACPRYCGMLISLVGISLRRSWGFDKCRGSQNNLLIVYW